MGDDPRCPPRTPFPYPFPPPQILHARPLGAPAKPGPPRAPQGHLGSILATHPTAERAPWGRGLRMLLGASTDLRRAPERARPQLCPRRPGGRGHRPLGARRSRGGREAQRGERAAGRARGGGGVLGSRFLPALRPPAASFGFWAAAACAGGVGRRAASLLLEARETGGVKL